MDRTKLFSNLCQNRVLNFPVLVISLILVFNGNIMAGEVLLPGTIEITIGELSTPGKPININILAVSTIPFKDGRIELLIPGFGNNPPQKINVWSGRSDAPIKKHLNYSILLPFPGKYKVTAYFRFTPLQEGATQVTVTQALYLDITGERVSSAHVPSTQDKQTQLKMEGTIQAAFADNPTAKEAVTMDSPGKAPVLIKKAPFQGYKKVARKTINEINNEKLENTVKQSEYKDSEQAKAKRKAIEKKNQGV